MTGAPSSSQKLATGRFIIDRTALQLGTAVGSAYAPEHIMEQSQAGVIEEQLGAIIVDGQRCEVWVRSEPDGDGTWHNALLFRRAGRAAGREVLITGVSWHVPPGLALNRARELGEQEQIALFHRALAPRPPAV